MRGIEIITLTFNISDLHEKSKSDPQEVLNDLKKESPEGIGTVYLITLLYFISKGKYPIYDRFANLALEGIYRELNPQYASINDTVLPDKNDKGFDKVYENYICPYMNKIKEIFKDDYFGDNYSKKIDSYRNIDRALWVYGHAFSKGAKKC